MLSGYIIEFVTLEYRSVWKSRGHNAAGVAAIIGSGESPPYRRMPRKRPRQRPFRL